MPLASLGKPTRAISKFVKMSRLLKSDEVSNLLVRRRVGARLRLCGLPLVCGLALAVALELDFARRAEAASPQDKSEAGALLSSGGPNPGHPNAAAVVAGILNFTQWPQGLRPIRVCVMGEGRAALALLVPGALGLPESSVAVRRSVVQPRLDEGCEVLYLGQTRAGLQTQLLAGLAEHPVLTIGEGAAFCSDGGMFCLESDDTPVRFGVNIDSISRSGLRVNPQVLWLARRSRGVAP